MNAPRPFIRAILTKYGLACTDFIFFASGPLIAAAIIHVLWGHLDSYIPPEEIESRMRAHFFLSVACVAWFWLRLRHYTYRKPFWFELKETLRTIIIFAIIDLAIEAFSKWQVSRYVWVFTWGSILLLLPLSRQYAKKALKKLGLWGKPSVIIGNGPNAEEAYQALSSENNLGLDFKYIFATSESHSNTTLGIPVINDERKLWEYADPKTTQFFIAVEFDEEAKREYWIKTLARYRCRGVSIIPTTRGVPLNSTDMSFIFSREVLILRVHNNLVKLSARVLKRMFDVIGALIFIILLSPLLAVLTIMTMRDGGNPIYGHERIGLGGRKFKCLKFRSMVLNSKEILENLLATDPKARAEWEQDFKLKDDPRITKLGAFIRKTSLDELPQLWNVLRGDMSLVGPRPVVDEELARYTENVDYYLMAKPGMTGLWQVSGRNDVDYDTRVYFDAWYVKNWSMWIDIAILFKTINVVFKRSGAY